MGLQVFSFSSPIGVPQCSLGRPNEWCSVPRCSVCKQDMVVLDGNSLDSDGCAWLHNIAAPYNLSDQARPTSDRDLSPKPKESRLVYVAYVKTKGGTV